MLRVIKNVCEWNVDFSLFFIFQARHRLSVGDYEGAKQAAKTAKNLGLAAVVIGGVFLLIVIVLRYSWLGIWYIMDNNRKTAWIGLREHDKVVEIDEFQKYLRYSNCSINRVQNDSRIACKYNKVTLQWNTRLLKHILDYNLLVYQVIYPWQMSSNTNCLFATPVSILSNRTKNIQQKINKVYLNV